jgi:hypothetical protein
VYIILPFTVPGQVVDLTLLPSSHGVILGWKKPSSNGDCVTHYAISWRHSGNGNTNSSKTVKDEYSVVIGSLDACVEYEISVRAVNERNESTTTVVNMTTETDGK